MRDARFRDAGRNPRPGALPRDARLALDNRPTAETLDDDSRPSRLGAPPNRRRPEDDVSSSSPSSESPPPLVSALAVSSRLLARFSPLCLAERRAFRHLARAARRLDLVASMRTRRSATARHLRRAWRFASSASRADPTAAPALTLLASALAEDERAAETFSRLKRVAREGLRDAAGRLRACAARNAWAAEAFRGAIREGEKDGTERAAPAEAVAGNGDVACAVAVASAFARDAAARLDALSDTQARLSERAFAALAGADPRAFAPSAEALARKAVERRRRRGGGGVVSVAKKKTTGDDAEKKAPPGCVVSRRASSRGASSPNARTTYAYDAYFVDRARASQKRERDEEVPREAPDCHSQSEPSTSSRREAPFGARDDAEPGRRDETNIARDGAFDDGGVFFSPAATDATDDDPAIRATQTQSPSR